MRSAARQRKWKHKESGGEECLHEEKINVESWGKQAGREEQTLPGAGWRLFTEEFYSHSYKGALTLVTHTNKGW